VLDGLMCAVAEAAIGAIGEDDKKARQLLPWLEPEEEEEIPPAP